MNSVQLELHIVEYAQLLESVGDLVVAVKTIQLNGMTVEELAKNVGDQIVAIVTYKIIEGTIDADGQTVPFSSKEYGHSGLMYIGGAIYDRHQFRAIDFNGTSYHHMLYRNYGQVIKCRTGKWQPFLPENGDRNISLG